MKLVFAPNAFKECLSSPDAAEALARGARRAARDAECVLVPLADGGDGTVEALVAARHGEFIEMSAHDPLMRPVDVKYGSIDNGETAIIEMAVASGLWRLSEEEKNPLKTTTFGTGEMMRDAIAHGAKRLIVGIGGSATTDAGIGMAAALGFRFLDSTGNELTPIGDSMNAVDRIDDTNALHALREVEILIASDVTNPLLGPDGAAAVYGPQKGATPDMVRTLEAGLAQINRCWQTQWHRDLPDARGGGAAGGLGAGLLAFCDAQFHSGFDLIADMAHLDEALHGADLVLTGEGKIDRSTVFGKVPIGVARRAKRAGVPAVAVAGNIGNGLEALYDEGLAAVFPLTQRPMALEEAIERAAELLERTAEQVIRLWLARNSK